MSSNFGDASYIFKGVVHLEEVVQMHLDFLARQDVNDINYSLKHYVDLDLS